MLKAKYFPQTDLLNATLKSGSSYTWISILATSKVFKDGLGRRVGKRDKISIVNHAWIPGSIDYKLISPIINSNLKLVSELIDLESKEWRTETTRVFDVVDAKRILRIPLAVIPHEHELIWRCEASSDFSEKSAYKLLYTGTTYPNFHNLQIDPLLFTENCGQ